MAASPLPPLDGELPFVFLEAEPLFLQRFIMPRVLLAIVFAVAVTPLAWSCWSAKDPSAFAEDCPIIVAGSIESVQKAAPGGQRSDDIASIRVDAVHRNELTDVPLKVGDLLAVRMISQNNQQRSSTDLNYPVKSKAIWLVLLTSKGEFRIDAHPVQKQPFQDLPKLRLMRNVNKAGAGSDKPVLANPQGSKTKAEWVAWKQRQEEQQAKASAAHSAQQQAIRDLAQEFAERDGLEEKVWKRFQEAEPDVRRGIFQLNLNEQPMTGPRLAEVAQGVLLHEKDDNIRTHAVSQLAYCRDPGAKGMEVLGAALRDRSASVRLFACQSVKMRRYEPLADQVKKLQNDPDAQVREMASDTLEFWRKNPKESSRN